MAKEVQDDSMVAPEPENPQEPSGEAIASTDKPQDPPREAIASSIHGDAGPSSIRNLTDTSTSTERCDRNDEKKKEDGKKELENEDDDIDEDQKTLEYAEVLMDKGSTALKEKDYETAVECYSRALEIRVIHFGELDQECFSAYYFYGLALLRNVLAGSLSVSNEDGNTLGESCSMSCASSHEENDESSDPEDSSTEISDSEDSATGSKEEENEFDTDDSPDNDADDLDLAWQILDIARIIVEKRQTPSMDNVNVLCALGEINNYRDDYVNCLLDYGKAMGILMDLDDPDLFLKAKTYYQMGLCVEMSVRTEESILYYEHALSSCSIVLKSLERDLDSFLSEKIAVPDTLISKKREEIAEVQNFSEMLKLKLQDEGENNNKHMADIRRAVNSLSAKVRKLQEDVCSSSSSTEYIFIGTLGGTMKTIHLVLGTNSFDFSTESSNSENSTLRKSSNTDNPTPPKSPNSGDSSPPKSSDSDNSSSSNSSSDNPSPLKIPKLESDAEGSTS